MENYEVEFSDMDTEEVTEVIQDAPEAAPKKVSPFADSPYVMHHEEPIINTPKEAPKQKKKPRKVLKAILSCVLIIALVATGCLVTARSVNGYWSARFDRLYDQIEDLKEQIEDNSFTGNGNSVSGTPNINYDGMTPGQIYTKCVDSVVAITAQVSNAQGVGSSSGSGFIISEDGYIISNYHVVEGASQLIATVHDGTEYPATLIGYDDTNDLALLKVDATGLQAATLGNSDNLIVGDQVVAIGNPLGELTSTLTVGYISAKERDVSTDNTIINMLQTDAAINPGNSGGPLFNMKGEVVGITTAKYSGATSSGATIEGIGFAIPMNDVVDKIKELQTNGYVSTPYMGVSVTNQAEGIGAYVASVEPGSSAAAAGIRAGDIIVELGGHEISAIADITRALRDYKVGDSTSVTVYRSRQLLELTITFGEKPQNSTDNKLPSGNGQMPDSGDYYDWWDYFFGDDND